MDCGSGALRGGGDYGAGAGHGRGGGGVAGVVFAEVGVIIGIGIRVLGKGWLGGQGGELGFCEGAGEVGHGLI